MNRRSLLASVAALSTTGLVAGCAADAPAEAPAGTGTPTDTPSPTPSATPSPTPTVSGTNFTITNVGSGTRVNEASVAFEDDRVVVTGTIAGADGCKTASLKDATLADGTLEVTVGTKDRPDADMCTQAIVEIDYEVTVDVAGPAPARVSVTHESMGETVEVASADRPTP